MNKSEEDFTEYLESKGWSWIYEPIKFSLLEGSYTPDFYCSDNDTFFEVVNTRQAFSSNKIKYAHFILEYPDLIFLVVNPNGVIYKSNVEILKIPETVRIKKDGYGIFNNRINFWIDDKLLKQVDLLAKKRGWKRSLVIREAIKKYLDDIK